MTTIIAARLQLQTQAEEAIRQLIGAGVAPEKVTSFYVNPPGQHAMYPIGGDRYRSPGTDETTLLGAAMDIVTEAILGAALHEETHGKKGDAAHAGKTINECINDDATNDDHALRLRHAGMLVAVELADPAQQDQIVTLLTRLGANDIEKAEGEITDGEWSDFDPLREPCFIKAPKPAIISQRME